MQPKKITSQHNPLVKKILQLREPKHRRTASQTIVEGVREMSRAVAAGIKFDEIIICPAVYDKYADGRLAEYFEISPAIFSEVDEAVFAKLSYGDRCEGILGICGIPQYTLDDLKLDQSAMLIVAEGVEKPGNLGAILRTAEAAGVQGVIVCDSPTDIYNPNVIRASLGSIFLIPTVKADKEQLRDFLKKRKIKSCAAMVQADSVYTRADLRPPIAFILGSEQKGLSPFWSEQADLKVKIPMHGETDSLNVSVSAAIIIYESIRQQTIQK